MVRFALCRVGRGGAGAHCGACMALGSKRLRVKRAINLRAVGEASGVAYDTIDKLELGRPAHASAIRSKVTSAFLDVELKEIAKGDR